LPSAPLGNELFNIRYREPYVPTELLSVPTVSLHVHERIDPRSIIEAVRKKNGEDFVQGSLFSRLDENPPIREAIEFYKHKHNWSNRLIAGDSLLVMNSQKGKVGFKFRDNGTRRQYGFF
jgi:hypothetical protein